MIYAGDNQVVRSWVQKRTAPRAIAAYLLQLLSVLESVYGFRVYTAYIRTYHNRTADDLTRLDPAWSSKGKACRNWKMWPLTFGLCWIGGSTEGP